MYRIDLHTHSDASPDGGITLAHYRQALEKSVLDMIAVTDHNTVDNALRIQAELGDRIIVGEEIMSAAGEIVGLYLTQTIQPGLTPEETIRQIKDQGGVVYVPHPFETVRKGLHPAILESLIHDVDLIEVCNGRAFLQNRSEQAYVWAKLNHVIGAASSDAHGAKGLGKTYTSLKELPTRATILELCTNATLKTEWPGIRALLYPKYHRLRRKVKKS